MATHRFVVGQEYENLKGVFRVVKLEGGVMRIRWEDGREVETTVEQQEKILHRMESRTEPDEMSAKKGNVEGLGVRFDGLKLSDFSDDVTGTKWRSREQLGGAVTKLLEVREPFNSWSIYNRSEVHWACSRLRGRDSVWLERKFYLRLNEKGATFGYYVERSNDPRERRNEWLEHIGWLKNADNVRWMHALSREQGLSIFDPYPSSGSSFQGRIKAVSNGWKVEMQKREMTLPLMDLPNFLDGLPQTRWVDLVIGKSLPRKLVVESELGFATELAELFNLMMPMYWGESPVNTQAVGRLAFWLNVDRPTKRLTLHFSKGCKYEVEKGSGPLKPVGAIGVNGGWLGFADVRSVEDYVRREWPAFLAMELCSSCASRAQLSDLSPDVPSEEGRRVMAWHQVIERDSRIVSAKKDEAMKLHGKLACEVCAFDFEAFYGVLGEGFCEVHHLHPLGERIEPSATRMEDLAILCSNCHRMIHRGPIALSLGALRTQLGNLRGE